MREMLLLTAGILLHVVSASAREPIAKYDWSRMEVPQGSAAVERTVVDGRNVLRIENTTGKPLTIPLLLIDGPQIRSKQYALAGEVKYSGVEGTGYLEMWSTFAPRADSGAGKRYFTRTLASMGKLASLSGSSSWRPFLLPFNIIDASGPPTRLEMNLVLPSRGTVYLSPVRLTEQWWSQTGTGLLGGVAGGIVGCLGGLIGWLVSRGRARAFVLGLICVLIGLGVLCAGLAAVALLMAQPVHVCGPLLLLGAIHLAIFPMLLHQARHNYAALELRRMAAMDAMLE